MTSAKPKILIIADNASHRFGGEAILPLKYFSILARRGRDVRLITHERNRDTLEEVIPDLMDRVSFTPDTPMLKLLWRIAEPMPGAIRDHLFGNLMALITGREQRRLARALVGPDTVIHQPTPVSPAAPSMIHDLGAPVIIGPMNGGMSYPPGYEDFEGRASRLFVRLGRPFSGLVNRLIPGKRRAAMLLAANERTVQALPPTPASVRLMSENAVDFDLFPGIRAARPPRAPDRLRLVYMGRLVALKALDLSFHALARARAANPDIEITLDVLGDGPERGALKVLSHELGLRDAVTFHGFVPQVDCARMLVDSDALILNSLRECGGAVILEAQAMGLAVIASDWGGPRDYVGEDTGILVPPSPRAGFEDRLADAISRLARDPELTRSLGFAGAQRVRNRFAWTKRIDQIEMIYDEVRHSARSS